MLGKIITILLMSFSVQGSQPDTCIVEISKARYLNQKLFEHGNSKLLLEVLMSEECNKVLWQDFAMEQEYRFYPGDQLQVRAELTHITQANVDELGKPVEALACAMQVWYPEKSYESFQDPYVKVLCVALAKLYGQNCELERQLKNARQRNHELQDSLNVFKPYKSGQVSVLQQELIEQLEEIRKCLGVQRRDQELGTDPMQQFNEIRKDLEELRDAVSLSLRGYQIIDPEDIADPEIEQFFKQKSRRSLLDDL